MSPAQIYLLLAASLVVLVAGLSQYHRGWAQKADAAKRSRLERGEPASRRLRGVLDARLRRTAPGRWLDGRLTAAGLSIGPSAFLVATLAAAAITGTVLSALMGRLLGGVAALAAVVACLRYVDYRRARRRDEFVAQLPDLARVLSNASSAGMSLPRAIDLAVSELDDPASDIMQRVVDELRLGQSIERSLENLGDRMPSREVAVLVTTLVIQQRAGGDTVRALRDMAETLEARKDLRRELRTVMAGAITTGWIVGGIGIGALVLLNLISPGVLEQMSQETVGRIGLIVGLGLYAVGFLLVRRTTRIES